MAFGREILGDVVEASRLEWLVTNGIGGFASSSITGMNTRRYHGVLVASMRPPVERLNLVSRLEESLLVEGNEIQLSTNRYAKLLYPAGYRHLELFERDPFPTWTWQIEDILIKKSLFMIHGKNATVVQYKVSAPARRVIELRVRPHFLFRDFHGNVYENPGFINNTEIADNGLSFQPFANAPTIYMKWDHGEFRCDGYWYRDIFLQEESHRGLNAAEDDYSNGSLHISDAASCRNISIVFSDSPVLPFNVLEARKQEEQRLSGIAGGLGTEDPLIRRLLLAADQFIVGRHSTHGKSIIAGYPWFSDWGRDSLISLPGLTLVTGRFDDARSILRTFAATTRNGLVPNCFADRGSDALYNSVDASLWFFFAVYKYIEYTDDYAFVYEHLFQAMKEIIEAYQNGTHFSIRMDPDDGLISAGEAGIQLTWMDAKVDDWVVTPREGKAVEINALWYNALKIYEMLLDMFVSGHSSGGLIPGESQEGRIFPNGTDLRGISRETALLARKVRASFRRAFWNNEGGYLADVIRPDSSTDAAFRPNQVFAVYLPFSLIDPPHEKSVIEAVFRKLYTSMGLRSLAPMDDSYIGLYEGDRLHRDEAYHQGTVWSYLIGPFITAYLKVNHGSMDAHIRAAEMVEALRAHLEGEACIGSVSEVFDGEPPHRSGGCVAQAWSVAELLRCYVEDIKGQRPTFIL
ncbi:MAG: glycogen debranching enzyme family protein [Candidatus Riflebacteria bacterium]|nr:glycogen debranching enzyme family protein [Candidatus Riflebacteria bacterium]